MHSTSTKCKSFTSNRRSVRNSRTTTRTHFHFKQQTYDIQLPYKVIPFKSWTYLKMPDKINSIQ